MQKNEEKEPEGVLVKTPENWSEIESAFETIRKYGITNFETPLFRGQSDSTWKIETTLQRAMGHAPFVEKYYEIIRSVRPQIQSITGKSWSDDYQNIEDAFWDSIREGKNPPLYEYMVYLRHCGFPSPLLDWSVSPYVALYFACHHNHEKNGALYAIYKSKQPDPLEGPDFEYRTVKLLSDSVDTHDRHFRQKAKYSIAVGVRPGMPNSRVFLTYEHSQFFVGKSPSFIVSIKIKKELKPEILWRLDELGINSYSLFGGQDDLVQSIADRIFLAKQPSKSMIDFGQLVSKLKSAT